MKKTIAILLVLVIGMVGVWAATDATAAVQVTVEITPVSEVIITDADPGFTAASTYEDFDALEEWSTIDSVAKDEATIGYLNYFSNKTTGLTTTFTATVMADNGATPVTTTIGYLVKVGSVSKAAGEGASEPITLVASGVTGSTIGTEAIKVDVVDNDYDTAAVPNGDYIGTITFTYLAD